MDQMFEDALAELDAQIAAATRYYERAQEDVVRAQHALNELKVQRRGATYFVDFLKRRAHELAPRAVPPTEPSRVPPSAGEASGESVIDSVMAVFEANPMVVLTIDSVLDQLARRGSELDRTQIRNGIHHAVRKGWIEKAGKRGTWVYRNASAPAGTRAEEGKESTSGSLWEKKGESDESSELPRGGGEPAVGP